MAHPAHEGKDVWINDALNQHKRLQFSPRLEGGELACQGSLSPASQVPRPRSRVSRPGSKTNWTSRPAARFSSPTQTATLVSRQNPAQLARCSSMATAQPAVGRTNY